MTSHVATNRIERNHIVFCRFDLIMASKTIESTHNSIIVIAGQTNTTIYEKLLFCFEFIWYIMTHTNSICPYTKLGRIVGLLIVWASNCVFEGILYQVILLRAKHMNVQCIVSLCQVCVKNSRIRELRKLISYFLVYMWKYTQIYNTHKIQKRDLYLQHIRMNSRTFTIRTEHRMVGAHVFSLLLLQYLPLPGGCSHSLRC